MARILIIEDDTTMNEWLTLLLTEAGHKTMGARDGKVGLTLHTQDPFDLIVTDIQEAPGAVFPLTLRP